MAEQTALDIKFTQRFSGNLLSNMAYFVLNLIIGLALAPFFLDTLGPAAYGLIPLATSVTSYITLLIDSVNASVSRFLTIDLQKGDIAAANKTFNTALFGTLGIIVLLIPVALTAALLAPQFFNIGEQSYTSVFLLFALVFASVLIRAWSSNFMVTLFANNRLDYRNYVNITNLLMQIALIVLLFSLFGPSLVYVGISYFIAAVAAFILAYILSKKICPYLKIQPKNFVLSRFKEIGNVALWMGFNALGSLFYGHIGLMVVNKFFGEISGTQYSLCLMWGTLLISTAGLITNTFTPMIYSHYAKNNREGMLRFTKFTIKVTGLVMALPIGLVYIFAPQLMTFWVGAEYAGLALIIWILLSPLMCQVQASCISPINAAYKRVRIPAIGNFLAGMINLALALSLPFIFDIGMYGVAIAYAVSMFFLTGFVSPFYNAYVVGAPVFTYFKYMLMGMAVTALLVAAGMVYSSVVPVDSLIMLIASGLLISVVYLVIVLRCVLKKDERKMIRACVPKKLELLIPEWVL